MAIHGGLNESKDEKQSINNVDVEAALWERDGIRIYWYRNEYGEGNKNDWNVCIAGSSTGPDDSTTVAQMIPQPSTTISCVNRSTKDRLFWIHIWRYLIVSSLLFIGSLIVGFLPIVLDIVQHYAILKRFQDLIILVLPLAGLISSFCNSLATRFPSNGSILSNFNQQPKPKFIEYWAPRFVMYYTGVIIIGTVVFFNRRGWNAEPMDSTIDLMLITWCAVLCSFLLMGIAQVVICLLSPYVWLMPVILSTQWWSTIWTELSTSPLSFIIEQLMENIGVQWRAWAAVVSICFFALFGYCICVTFKNKTARNVLKEARWKAWLTTLLTQSITGLLLYEAIRLFEDVEILYQISLTLNNFHMTYVSNVSKTNLIEENNTPSGQILASGKTKGWWFAFKTAAKSTIVYALMLFINLIYILFFTTYRLNLMFLGAFCVISTLALICRLFVMFYGIKILKKLKWDLDSWIPNLNVLGVVMNMICLRFMVLLYSSAEMAFSE